MQAFSEERTAEFIVNDIGNAMLLYQGALPHSYSWVQFDEEHSEIKLITDEGDAQDLGVKIPQDLSEGLKHANEILMLEIDDSGEPKDAIMLKFVKTV